MLVHKSSTMTEAEYLRLEQDGQVRHEYVNGEVFAMTGATLRHNTIALNIAATLRAHLRGTPCRAFVSDARVRVAKGNAHYYPDVVVSCSPGLQVLDSTARCVEDPVLIVEVLSESTEGTDRREKLLAYRTVPSLKEYVLVDPGEALVTVHRRHGDIGWDVIEYSGPEEVEFPAVELRLPMRDIYDGVPIDALTTGPR
ncbi:MAG: Uma2 family endonuclease [Betaproteobacteria bacterium]|nr:Uma2 family endonuclease [Betaproteobacteria bacterium]